MSESANSTFDSDISDLFTSSEHENLRDVALECSVRHLVAVPLPTLIIHRRMVRE